MRPRAELEHDGSQPKLLDRGAHGVALRLELLERGADEDSDALVGSADHRGPFGHEGIIGTKHAVCRPACPAVVYGYA